MLLDTKFKELGIKPLEAPNVEFLEERVSEKRKQKAMFYGSGIARRVFSQSVVFDLPLSVLFMFCAEGDNSADAYKYADKVNQLVKIIDVPKPTGDIPPEYQSFVPCKS